MEVQLKHLAPNPFRNLPHYPIDKGKLNKLKSSIKRTGFWDNIVARKSPENGSVEIAYGHHRRQALLDLYPGTHKVNVILRDLDDGTMIKVMADENDEIFNLSPAVINETVLAARNYLKTHPEEVRRTGPAKPDGYQREAKTVADFLDWDVQRVEEALAQLSDIEEKHVVRDAIEKIPSQKAAERFRKTVKKYNAPASVQRDVAAKLKTQEIGTKDIREHIAKGVEALDRKAERVDPKLIRFEEFVREGNSKLVGAVNFLNKLNSHFEEFGADVWLEQVSQYKLGICVQDLGKAVEKFNSFKRRSDVKTHGVRRLRA